MIDNNTPLTLVRPGSPIRSRVTVETLQQGRSVEVGMLMFTDHADAIVGLLLDLTRGGPRFAFTPEKVQRLRDAGLQPGCDVAEALTRAFEAVQAEYHADIDASFEPQILTKRREAQEAAQRQGCQEPRTRPSHKPGGQHG